MPPTESMFLVPESREQPMHVGSLQLFTLPDGADHTYLRGLYEQSIRVDDVAPLFRRRPYRSAATLGQWTWKDDRGLDLEHHVRHSALPEPGRVRELLALVSRLHGTLLDRKRPLWEAHLVEGLEGDRFAVYTKIHHAMMDGVSGLRLLQRSLSTDPDERSTPVPWAARPRPDRPKGPGLVSQALAAPGAALQLAGNAVTLTPALLRLAEQGLRQSATVLPGQAPHTLLNTRITGSRRFAADSWSLERIRDVARRYDATVNDVVLAMCSGALRRYLLEEGALPASPLVAMTPVSLRKDDDAPDASGNAVGTILCNLATDLADPQARLLAVRASMRAGKAAMAGLSQPQVTALSALVMAPLLPAMLGLQRLAPLPYNLVISNVPGPAEPLYWNGARLEGIYPLSIPTHGQALNITVTSYAGRLQFGLTGCRRTVPRLQRLLVGLDESLGTLEQAAA